MLRSQDSGMEWRVQGSALIRENEIRSNDSDSEWCVQGSSLVAIFLANEGGGSIADRCCSRLGLKWEK